MKASCNKCVFEKECESETTNWKVDIISQVKEIVKHNGCISFQEREEVE